MNITCPCCHAKHSLEAALECEASGELQMIIAQAGPLARPLVAYLGLFRSKTRALSFDRATRLASEVMGLSSDPRLLGAALTETVEALRRKRDAGDVRPLKDHQYLKTVLQSVSAAGAIVPAETSPGSPPAAPRGKRAQGMAALEEWGRE